MTNIIRYNAKPSVYGTGLVALDIVLSSTPNEPAYHWAGGTCGNVLTILSYLGWNSFPIARLNKESSSVRVKEDMKKWKVRLDFSELNPNESVPVITQELSRDKSGAPVTKFHWKNCPKCGSWLPNYKAVTLSATKVVKDRVKRGEVFFFDRTSAGALDLARHFKSLGCVIFFEPSAKGDIKHFTEAIKLADIVKYSMQRFPSLLAANSLIRHQPFLEIQTLGEDGLRYRMKKQKDWQNLPAFEAEDLVDPCGCGDWTTAGIISILCGEGIRGLVRSSAKSIKTALIYGQALGVWNCSFEGARSGMYRIKKRTFKKEIEIVLKEGILRTSGTRENLNSENASDGLCPACPNL
ncbi:MAG: hypothetical protein KC643_02955 [Nitrospira sp.]|nr:hypothetical protein [Nitrospira sp.]